MDSEPIQLSYSVNGEHLGVAADIPKEDLKDSPLFPHILTKNCTFEVNFGQKVIELSTLVPVLFDLRNKIIKSVALGGTILSAA